MNDLMTTRDVMRALGIRYWTLYGAMRSGDIPSPRRKIGVSHVWSPDEVETVRQYFAANPPRHTPGPKPKKGAA